MRLNEFEVKPEEMSTSKPSQLPFDVVDDLHFHMRNDRNFYRKSFLPVVVKIAGDVNEEEGLDKLLDPMLKDAVEHYCQEYKIPPDMKKLINGDVLAQVKERIMSDDIPSIQKGEQ